MLLALDAGTFDIRNNNVMKGPLSISELRYGVRHKQKTPLSLKLITIYLEQMREREGGNGASSTVDYLMQGKK